MKLGGGHGPAVLIRNCDWYLVDERCFVAVKNSFGIMSDVSAPLQNRITEINHQGADKMDASPRACDSLYPDWSFLPFWSGQGPRREPPQVWKNIIETGMLCSPSEPYRREGSDYLWVSFHLRCPSDVEQADQSYYYEKEERKPTETVTAYHNTTLESLVNETRLSNGQRVGNGILKDGRLRYGHRTDGGIMVYSGGGLDTFDGSMKWVQLELKCSITKRAKGRRTDRYWVCGTAGEKCEKAALVRLLVPLPKVP